MWNSPPGEHEPASDSGSVDGQALNCQWEECLITPSLPPTSKGVSLLGGRGGSSGVLFPKLGRGGVKHWDAGGGGGDPAAPPRQFLASTACLLCRLPRTARGPGRPRLQPGGLAAPPPPGPAARPARWTLNPHTSQRRWPGFSGSCWWCRTVWAPPPPPTGPQPAHHHIMTLHLRLLAGQLVTFELQAEKRTWDREWGLGLPPNFDGRHTQHDLLCEDGVRGTSSPLTGKWGLKNQPCRAGGGENDSDNNKNNKSERTSCGVSQGFKQPFTHPPNPTKSAL